MYATPALSGIVDSTADFTDTVDLPFGGSITYTVTATVRADASGPLTNIVTVTPPTGYGDTDDTNDSDSDENLPASLTVTKDDGLTVVAPGSVITYTIEVTNNGSVDLTDITVTDTLPDDVAFQSATPAPATTPDVGDPGGDVTWTGISLAVNESITLTLTVQVIAEPGAIFTNLVVAEDGVTGQRDEDDDTDLVAVETGKLIFDTNEPTTVTPNVTIGEIVTYQISLDVPAMGTMTNLQALDVLDYGLAFVRCVSIEGGALETNYGQADPADFAADFSPICADPANPTVAAQPPGNLDPEHQGRRVTFDFGDVRNSGAEDVRLVVTYEVVVLNILGNQDGVDNLNNTVLWTWDGGSLQASAPPLEIVEPDMDIVKDVSPSVAPYGATINFTFDIYHTPESTADAFDVVATDILPPGLAFVPGSVSVIGLPPTDIIYDEPRTTLTFVWDHFPLGETSLIEFQTTFVGPAPVTNTVNLEWTSLPIDPGLDGEPIQQSDYNEFSTERWYDPPDDAGLNTYGVSSSVTIRLPSVLPATGFAPGRVSALPPQPAEKAYNAISGVWIEIPDLGVRLPMLDVPLSNDGWDLTWLSNQAGYLAGTTQPGDVGTMGVTAHVTLADGTPGPFQNLRQLFWGNKIIMYANGYRYTYEVRENRLVLPRDMSVLRQDGYAWMTLITCEGYSSFLDDYTYRVAVRAVLLSVEPDNTPYPFASQPGSSAPSRSPAPQVPGGDR
ncbi:MAG: sortase [Anaerolineales bacterium]